MRDPRQIADDKEVLEAGLPYIRSALAFLLKMRFGMAWTIDDCYKFADAFIKQLKQDLGQ